MEQKRAGSAAFALLFGAVCLLATACGIDVAKVPSAVVATPSNTTPQIDIPSASSSTTAPAPLREADLVAVAANVQDFWATELPAVYQKSYQPLPADRVVAGTPDASYPICDSKQLTYKDVQGNAFAASCREGPTVVWDATELLPSIGRKYGPVAAAIVLAHEWGHIAQFQAGVEAETVILEQQADCFAGIWLKHLIDDPGKLGSLSLQTPLDSAVSSIIEFRDAPGSSPDSSGAHGSGFDRVRALQEGYTKGGAYCAGYIDKPPPLIRLGLPDTTQDPNATGNLALADLVPLVVDDLNAFYNKVVTGFRGASADAVLGDSKARKTLEGLSSRIGDNAAGVVMGMIWAGFAQDQVKGAKNGRDAQGLLQQKACLSGGWLANVYNDTGSGTRNLQLTAGDLDEAILGLIDLEGDQGAKKPTDGSVFQLIGSLRQGVVDGFNSCRLGK